jgi:hypothetical protein
MPRRRSVYCPGVTSARIRATSRLWPASVAMLVAGCHIEFSGLKDLFDPNPTYLDLPGRRLDEGHFEKASVDGTDASGAYVIAFDTQADTTRLAILPFAGGHGCRTGHADRYQGSQFGTRSDITPFVQFVENATGTTPTRLHMANQHCEEPLAAIDGSAFPFGTAGGGGPRAGYLTLTSSADLLFLQPWADKQTTVSSHTTDSAVAGDKLWSIEAGQLVVRNFAFVVLGRFGADVKEFDVTPNAVTRAAYVDGTDLFVVTDKLDTAVKIDSDACNVAFPSGWHGLGVSYNSPCSTRRLVLYGSAHLSDAGPGVSDVKHVLGDGALGVPSVAFSGNDAFAFFVSGDDPKAGSGALWGGAIGEPPEHIGDQAQVNRSKSPVMTRFGTSWQTLVDVSGGVGSLIRWKPGAPSKELAQRVEEVATPLAIVNYDGKVGDLVHFDGSGISRVLARRVPRRGIVSDTEGLAVLAESDGSQGTLLVSPPDSTTFETVATNVPTGSFHFIQELHGIGYLRDFDAPSGTGELGIRVVETGDTFDVGVRASEWHEVGWPEPGILYIVPAGVHAGIWFARLK